MRATCPAIAERLNNVEMISLNNVMKWNGLRNPERQNGTQKHAALTPQLPGAGRSETLFSE